MLMKEALEQFAPTIEMFALPEGRSASRPFDDDEYDCPLTVQVNCSV